ncbi:MAG: DUF4192 domain-containing protein [Actinomycetota bacterium]|nr:DUF4192 domain-containing protein [Actinomycetota bacterium]
MSDPRTTAPTGVPERLTLSSPDAFLAAIPHLLGFPPRDSVVLVGLADDGSGRETIRLTQRFDRPGTDLTALQLADLAQAATDPMAASGSTSVIVAVFGDENPARTDVLPATGLVDQLVEALDERDLWVKDALYTDGASRWSYGCQNPACCPIEGAPIADELRTMIAAEFAGAGAAMAPSRQALRDEVAPDSTSIERVAELIPAHAAPSGDVEGWRDEAIGQIAGLRQDPAPSPQTIAAVTAGLQDIRVRDTALWEMAHDSTDSTNTMSGLNAALRSAPDGYVAPVATTLAIQHWTRGDGARANACLDRAADDDPNYSLASMVSTAIGRALPPSSWTEVMQQLDRTSCRHGNSAPPQAWSVRRSPSMPMTASGPTLAI